MKLILSFTLLTTVMVQVFGMPIDFREKLGDLKIGDDGWKRIAVEIKNAIVQDLVSKKTPINSATRYFINPQRLTLTQEAIQRAEVDPVATLQSHHTLLQTTVKQIHSARTTGRLIKYDLLNINEHLEELEQSMNNSLWDLEITLRRYLGANVNANEPVVSERFSKWGKSLAKEKKRIRLLMDQTVDLERYFRSIYEHMSKAMSNE